MEHHSGPTSWLLKLPLLPHSPEFLHVNGAVVVFLTITVIAVMANIAIRGKQAQYIVPPSRLSFVGMVDLVVEMLHNMVIGILGHHGEAQFPFIAAITIFILFCNFMGLIPHAVSPSTNTNTTFALGIATFLFYHWHGVKAHGLLGYGKHFLMGLGVLGLPIALLEMVSHCIRPVSLGVRLFINLHIDHMLVTSFSSLFAWILPVPMLLFGILVCTIQAFVFAILTTVYVLMATEHE